jgi:hypothetical protein
MEMYQWIARRKGFTVSNIGYFVYVDGQHVGETGMLDQNDPATGWMRFNTAVIPYEGNDDWVEDALTGAKKLCLNPPARFTQRIVRMAGFLSKSDRLLETSAAKISDNVSSIPARISSLTFNRIKPRRTEN